MLRTLYLRWHMRRVLRLVKRSHRWEAASGFKKCTHCQGKGKLPGEFLPRLHVVCPVCQGTRYVWQ